MKHKPLISDGTVDVLASIGILIFGLTIYPLWRGWRYLRTGR